MGVWGEKKQWLWLEPSGMRGREWERKRERERNASHFAKESNLRGLEKVLKDGEPAMRDEMIINM